MWSRLILYKVSAFSVKLVAVSCIEKAPLSHIQFTYCTLTYQLILHLVNLLLHYVLQGDKFTFALYF